MKTSVKLPGNRVAAILLLAFLTTIQVASAATNYITFYNTVVSLGAGPVNPANGAVAISGTNLNAGDVVVFDGVAVSQSPSTGDQWAAIELNQGGFLGLTSATLGVKAETQNGGNNSALFPAGTSFGDVGQTTNHVRIELTVTTTGSTTNMSYVAKTDPNFTGTTFHTLSGSGLTFANNTITLTFGANGHSQKIYDNSGTMIVVNPTPTNGLVAAGQTLTFTGSILEAPPLVSVQWLKNGNPIANATNLTYTTPALTGADTGAQFCYVVTNLVNPSITVTSAVVTVSVRTTPGIFTIDFPDTSVNVGGGTVTTPSGGVTVLGNQLLAGDTVVLDTYVLATGTPSSDGWATVNLNGSGYGNVLGATLGALVRLIGGQPSQLFINGAAAPNLSTSGTALNRLRIQLYPSANGSTTNMGWAVLLDQNISGTFLPVVSGTNLTFAANSIALTFGDQNTAANVLDNSQAVSVYSGPSPTTQVVSVGSPASFSVLAKGWSPTYQWRKNGVPIASSNSRFYTTPALTLADNNAQYSVVVSNQLNSANVVTSSVATVSIRTPNNLTWNPIVDFTNWNTITTNWTLNGGASQTNFSTGDNATFDSLGYNIGGSVVAVTNAVGANAVTVNANGGETYVLQGAGTVNGQSLLVTGDGSGAFGLESAASFSTVTVDMGTLNVGYNGVSGSIQANVITNNATITFNNASGTLVIPAQFTGTGVVNQAGVGTTVLDATNGSITIGSISAGDLTLGFAPLGSIANNAELGFASSVDLLITNSMSGSGHCYFSGYQTTTLTGMSSHTGHNTIWWGPVIVDNPQALGDIGSGITDIQGSDRFGGLYFSNSITWSQELILEARYGAPYPAATSPHLANLSGTNDVNGAMLFNNSAQGGTEFNVEATTGQLTIDSSIVNNTTGTDNLNLQGSGVGIWNGAIADAGGAQVLNLRKRGSGTWILNGVNTYSGLTTVSNSGVLIINGLIGSGQVSVYGGILGGVGTIGGAITVASGGTLAPGTNGISTLTINNNLTLAAGSFTSVEINQTAATQDQIVGLTGLTYGGTLIVSNLSGTLTINDSFQLFSSASYTGAFAGISPASPGAGLVWNTNTLATDGTLRISSSVKPTPHFTSISVSGTTLTIAGTNGLPGGQYVLLGSTNVALPLIQWTPLLTNMFDGSGNINLSTNIINLALPQEFYILSQ